MILFDRVTKTYPGDKRPALDNISLHIEPNEFVFIVGKSGAGKSTLIKMITKEEDQTSGKIIVGGIDLDYVKKRYIPHYRRRLGVVFQDYKLLPNRTVYENVAFALEIAGMSKKEITKTVPKVLELVNLADKGKKFPRNLSGGERQRVAIARSVARQPKILIADEPTGNLDVVTTKEIIALLQKINDYGTTVVVTTHDENVVNNLQKRVITIKDGKIIRDQKENGVYRLDQKQQESKESRASRRTSSRHISASPSPTLRRTSSRREPTNLYREPHQTDLSLIENPQPKEPDEMDYSQELSELPTNEANTVQSAESIRKIGVSAPHAKTRRTTPRRQTSTSRVTNKEMTIGTSRLTPAPTLKAKPKKFSRKKRVI